jgi:hypothetical protein
MKIGTEGGERFLGYVALLPILAAALAPLPNVSEQAIAQAQRQALNARDLYYERVDVPPGLKCRVLLLDASGGYQAVSADSVFHTKDHIRVEFESNVLGYVYVLQHGSDSNWEILFPSAEVRDNNNRLQPMRPAQVPREEDFVFDQTPGQERLYVVLALRPEPDLERLLDLVRSRRQVEPRDDAIRSLFLAISKDMSLELLSRNLKISRTSTQNATYVVSTSHSDSRVISELVLNHAR